MPEEDTTRRDSGARSSLRASPTSKLGNPAAGAHSSPKKRRKVNHGKMHAPCKDNG
ncbi:hypothetical protein PHISP_02983 [Aspergillus sp. HF37]|nr:hypothetical protein PHISP_02983 [Aspergillus sp. HF37]